MINEKYAKQYCSEDISLIENYNEAINSKEKYDCHHKNEIILNKSINELKLLDLYYNRPANELIFLTQHQHRSLHGESRIGIKNSFYDKHHSEETKQKISDSHKGKILSEETKQKISKSLKGKFIGEKHPMFGKRLSEETRKKISESNKNMSEETRKKISESTKGEKNGMYGKGYKLLGEKNGMYGKSAVKGKHWKLVDGKRVYY